MNLINWFHYKAKVIFVCQVGDSLFKVARFASGRDLRRKIIGLDVENFSPDINDHDLSDKLTRFLKKTGYSNNPLTISLPRSQATCRFLKVPSALPSEIEKIACLQSARFLPYPSDELITGFQIVSAEKDGSSFINQIIVHKNIIERYIRLFAQVKPAKLNIILSSYGICNLYEYLNETSGSFSRRLILREPATPPSAGDAVRGGKGRPKDVIMVVDIDSDSAEAIVAGGQGPVSKKLLFSRAFKLSKDKANWQEAFVIEINRTRDAFLRETAGEPPQKIILSGRSAVQFKEILDKQSGLPVEILSYEGMVSSDAASASIIGLGLKMTNGYLSLLTKELKQQVNAFNRTRERLRLSVWFAVIILILALAVIRDFSNRNRYLNLLKSELAKIGREARELENIDNRFKFLEGRAKKKVTSLAFISEISQLMPGKVFLSNFTYEEDRQLVLRGQTDELNAVFVFASQLEKTPLLENFNIKVKHATKRKIQQQEVVDFEIICLQKALLKKTVQKNVKEDID